MAKSILLNPAYCIQSNTQILFDLQTPVWELANNKNLQITFTVPYRVLCPCCGAKMLKISTKKWQCSKQENVSIQIK